MAAALLQWQMGKLCLWEQTALPYQGMLKSPPLNLQVSCQDGLDALQRYLEQDLDTAYYLDPPYYVGERHYASGICRNFPHHRLAHLLHVHSSAPWVLSYNDCPEMRRLYSWAHVTEVARRTHSTTPLMTRKTELLIFSPRFKKKALRPSPLLTSPLGSSRGRTLR